jgi:hypothetical protein
MPPWMMAETGRNVLRGTVIWVYHILLYLITVQLLVYLLWPVLLHGTWIVLRRKQKVTEVITKNIRDVASKQGRKLTSDKLVTSSWRHNVILWCIAAPLSCSCIVTVCQIWQMQVTCRMAVAVKTVIARMWHSAVWWILTGLKMLQTLGF